MLSRPTAGSIRAMAEMDGDLLILGVGGKMGPSLARLARRSAAAAGCRRRRVIGAARFSQRKLQEALERDGIETIRCDLLEAESRARLPRVDNVLLMMGHKFSTDDLPGQYWAMNTYLPGLLAEQYRAARIVCFSSGNVYPFTPIGAAPPTETVPCQPLGEYAITTWGRERMLQYVSSRYSTPVCLLRLNYAVEARYGVLVDLAERILAGTPIDLSTPRLNFVWQGYANSVALEAFSLAAAPAEILNLTGVETHSVRHLAVDLGDRLGVAPQFVEPEGPSALLSDAHRCHRLFGPPEFGANEMLDLVAGWLKSGQSTLGKPTRYEVRDGRY